MGRADRARGDARGGEDIPQARTGGAALSAGAAAAATAVGLTAWLAVAAESEEGTRGIAALGALATLTLAGGLLLRQPLAVGACALLLGLAYALLVAVDGGAFDRGAALFGALVLLLCELGYWSHELRTTSPDEPGVRMRHLASLALLVLGALAGALALEVVAEAARVEGVAIDAVGATAAIVAFALLARLALVGGGARREARGQAEVERQEEAPWRGA